MAITLRVAGPEDRSRLLSLAGQAGEAEPWCPQAIRQVARYGGDHRLWVISSGDRLAGFVVLRLEAAGRLGARVHRLEDAYLAPEFRGRGMMARVIRFLRELGRAPGQYELILGEEWGAVLRSEVYHRGRPTGPVAHQGRAA
ncbi:MAG: GNAT family N-acetyltransferase [Gemmatimonadales bacterium]